MASSPTYLQFIMDQLSSLAGCAYRPMMGEYILYVQGKVIGGIYDDRLLVKPTPSAVAYLPDAALEAPYPGAKPLLRVDVVDDRALLTQLLSQIASELPMPKAKKRPR